MTQTVSTTERDARRPNRDQAKPLATCQVCGAAHTPGASIFCRVCGEPVIVWGWAP